ncbi:MAG: glycosyltransferase family 9 protein [Alphaproteobacteria bacterium]|nr:glycosyltransferase family 9 protein [Alphaproteobacteria bacterium]
MKLLFITSSRIGDAVISTGVLNHLVSLHPGIEVTVAAAPLTLPLFEAVPGLAQLIPINKKSLSRHWINLWKVCRTKKWDIILDIRGSLVSYFLPTKKRFVWKSMRTSDHRVDQLGRLIQKVPPPPPHVWLGTNHLQRAQSLISSSIPVLALAPAANWIGKQWPADYFIELIEQFLKHNAAQIAIFGAPQERSMIQPIINTIPKDKCYDLVGNLSLLEIAACLKQCHVFLGNDSGLMHMAAAVGTPTIGLFGPSDDRMYAPYCPPENPVNHVIRIPESLEDLKKIPGFAFNAPRTFMENLKPDTVLQVLNKVWKKHVSH